MTVKPKSNPTEEEIIEKMFDKWDTNRFNILMGIRDEVCGK